MISSSDQPSTTETIGQVDDIPLPPSISIPIKDGATHPPTTHNCSIESENAADGIRKGISDYYTAVVEKIEQLVTGNEENGGALQYFNSFKESAGEILKSAQRGLEIVTNEAKDAADNLSRAAMNMQASPIFDTASSINDGLEKVENSSDEYYEEIDESSSSVSLEPSKWMAFSCVHEKRIWDITFPGTYKSASWPPFDNDKKPLLKNVFDSLLNTSIYCQRVTVYDQLRMGIRFLDIRVSKREENGILYCTSESCRIDLFEEVLEQIAAFLQNHRSEVLILNITIEIKGDNNGAVLDDDIDFWVALYLSKYMGTKLTETTTISDLVDSGRNLLYFLKNRERYIQKEVCVLPESAITNNEQIKDRLMEPFIEWLILKIPTLCPKYTITWESDESNEKVVLDVSNSYENLEYSTIESETAGSKIFNFFKSMTQYKFGSTTNDNEGSTLEHSEISNQGSQLLTHNSLNTIIKTSTSLNKYITNVENCLNWNNRFSCSSNLLESNKELHRTLQQRSYSSLESYLQSAGITNDTEDMFSNVLRRNCKQNIQEHIEVTNDEINTVQESNKTKIKQKFNGFVSFPLPLLRIPDFYNSEKLTETSGEIGISVHINNEESVINSDSNVKVDGSFNRYSSVFHQTFFFQEIPSKVPMSPFNYGDTFISSSVDVMPPAESHLDLCNLLKDYCLSINVNRPRPAFILNAAVAKTEGVTKWRDAIQSLPNPLAKLMGEPETEEINDLLRKTFLSDAYLNNVNIVAHMFMDQRVVKAIIEHNFLLEDEDSKKKD